MRSISISAVAGLVLLSALIVIPNVTAAAERTVNITDTTYVDKIVEIFPGDTVTWVNAGSQSHTITADNDSFTSGPLIPGARFSQKFMQPGFYPYHDTQNGASGGVGMSGVVRVVQQSTTPVQTVPAPVQTITTNTGATPSAATLYAQVLQLQQVLAALKAKAAAGTVTNIPTNTYTGPTGSAPCPRIGRVLKPGMSGDDVLRLQQFLAADASIYPDGSTTGYYGVLTQAAVQRWQIRNNIVATGDPETTGFGVVGPRTAAAMSLQCNTGGGPTGCTTPTLSGFIQVTPVMGTAPLVVSAQVTLNACQNTTYILDWGDGTNQTAIPFSANTCTSVQQTYAHTYAYGGQYAIKLAAGGHESSAVVVVDGPAKGATGTGATVSVLTITAPAAGLNLTAGQTVPISWQSNGTLPAGASIVFDLYTGAGEKVSESDVIAISSYASGSFSWTIPTPGGVCPAIYPGKLCGLTIPTGSYRIVAKAYQPSTSGNTFGALITEAASGIFTIIAAAGPGTGTGGTLVDTFTASVTSGQAPLSVNFTGKVTSANKGWCESGCFNFLQFGYGQG